MPGPSNAKLILAAAINNLNIFSSVLFEIAAKEIMAAICVNIPIAKKTADKISTTPIIFSLFSADLNNLYPTRKRITAKITLKTKGAIWE